MIINVKSVRPEIPKLWIETTLILKNNKPVQFGPRRLRFSEKEKIQQILNDLLYIDRMLYI